MARRPSGIAEQKRDPIGRFPPGHAFMTKHVSTGPDRDLMRHAGRGCRGESRFRAESAQPKGLMHLWGTMTLSHREGWFATKRVA